MYGQRIPIKTMYEANCSELSLVEYNAIIQEMSHYEDARAVSIQALSIVQRHRGWVSDILIEAISRVLGISASDLDGVATFYSHIYRTPVGRYVIRYCDSVVCYMTGYKGIQSALESYLCIYSGETTKDKRFTLLPTCCLGNCDKGPTIMINNDTYVYVMSEHISKLLEQYV
ncbi:NADH-quinone oxidoreductase subunit NuoE [Candidatus Erwinia haradaeae]|uniref:NADH-quinone oxidoreductase subunit E n=1 Tax=Candidatus Erwinia haradaeae TaxID=1922217 RepID=A0A803GC58_9GAMM|nr:NADH-quinone oxidoreductase subunit NuoE [Candidatus Erwinia haradaeae]VFP87227.1 NADH-quinone oxidoreductase subunit E [Candidatus Erwinia haradaeae]